MLVLAVSGKQTIYNTIGWCVIIIILAVSLSIVSSFLVKVGDQRNAQDKANVQILERLFNNCRKQLSAANGTNRNLRNSFTKLSSQLGRLASEVQEWNHIRSGVTKLVKELGAKIDEASVRQESIRVME